jgi:hypothetical protein
MYWYRSSDAVFTLAAVFFTYLMVPGIANPHIDYDSPLTKMLVGG